MCTFRAIAGHLNAKDVADLTKIFGLEGIAQFEFGPSLRNGQMIGTSEAEAWYINQKRLKNLHDDSTFEEFKKLIQAKFGEHPTKEFDLLGMAISFGQRKNETIEEYANRFEAMWVQMPTNFEVRIKFHLCVRGMQQDYLTKIIKSGETDIEEAIDLAKRIETSSNVKLNKNDNFVNNNFKKISYTTGAANYILGIEIKNTASGIEINQHALIERA